MQENTTNLSTILQSIHKDERTQNIIQHLTNDNKSRLKIDGIIGAFDCFLLASINEKVQQNHIIIAEDKDQAAYLQNTLNTLMDEPAHFFPDSFRRPIRFDEVNHTNVLQRTEAVNKITRITSKKHILVTYPEALFEEVVDPELLKSNQIQLTKGEDLDVDTAVELLVEYGFERVEYVYEPGQFSIRGGIVDIFSFGNEWPYRIELFDEEIESIRTFNPTDQLSIQNIASVSIIPNINNAFKQEEKVPLFKVFPKDTTVWIKDVDMLLEKLQLCLTKVEEFSKKISLKDDELLQKIFDERAFVMPDQVVEGLSEFNIVIQKSTKVGLQVDDNIKFSVKPQPSFNKNFQILIQALKENESKGLLNFIFTDSTKQIERFYNIFEDLNAEVAFTPIKKSLHEGFVVEDMKIVCYTDHQIFERFHKYKLRQGFSKSQAMSIKMLRELQPGDFVTHIDHGVGKYSGLETLDINGVKQDSVRLIFGNNDLLYVSVNALHKISKYVGKDGNPPKLSKIGGDAWKKLKSKTKRKIKDIAKELIKLYAQRKSAEGFAFPPDGYLQNELEASFIYEDTPDQLQATLDMKEDMMKPYPMDRLICGDVGFGKTEVAVRGAFKAVVGGKQVAVLVPTTILALQHAETFKKRLEQFGVSVDYINRFRTAKEKREIIERLTEGKLDIVIGTHAILNKNMKFKDLGLLIIDEEQKFGVAAKEKLRKFKVNVDTLTLTATPIPRTLQFSLMSARDLSVMRTPPPNRQPIHTERRTFSDEVIREAIYYEVNRGGQVFFVHNRVKNLEDMAGMVKRLCPDVRVLTAHGQMDPKDLEKALLSFINGEYDVLVSTNIIETGLDIANANTIIINNAHQFGMSDLHQLRGRVGRSNQKAFCYLFSPAPSVLTPDARKRIKTLEEFSDLGSGFHIAMRDLDIRGAGNLLGGEQSGFIADIGYETYQKILEEAVLELKENEFKDVFTEEQQKERIYVRDVEVDTDMEMLIPDNYVSNIQERLQLYTQLNLIDNEEKLEKFGERMADRFGPLPPQVKRLFGAIKLKWICAQLGFEKVSLKNKTLRCYFVLNSQSAYYDSPMYKRIFNYLNAKGEKEGLFLKQTRKTLIMKKENIPFFARAKKTLEDLYEEVKA